MHKYVLFEKSHSYIKTYQKDLTEDMIDLILNIAINIEWLNSMFLTALSVITLVNIPLSHHAPCIPIMFSSSIFSKLNSLKYSKSIMNVLRIVLLRYVPSQRMKKSVTKLWKYVLCIYIPTYIELFGRHQNATSSSFSAHSLSLPKIQSCPLVSRRPAAKSPTLHTRIYMFECCCCFYSTRALKRE